MATRILSFGAALLLVPLHANAQETPHGDVALALPATIRAGICGEGGDLGDEILFDLGLVGPAAGEEQDVPEADEVRGLQLSPPVMILEEVVDASFAELLDAAPAIVVSGDESGDPVACAQLGGVVTDSRLAVGLRPLSEERYYGVAVFVDASRNDEIDEGQVFVTLYLFQEQGPVGPLGHGETPTAESEAGA